MISGRRGRLARGLDYILADFGVQDQCQMLGNGKDFLWVDSQVLATFLGPLQIMFVDLGPDLLSET